MSPIDAMTRRLYGVPVAVTDERRWDQIRLLHQRDCLACGRERVAARSSDGVGKDGRDYLSVERDGEAVGQLRVDE